jgi:ribosomal protein S18 acetylase RimI-like enzyme
MGRSLMYVLEADGTPAASGALVLIAEDKDLADGHERGLVSNLIVDRRFQGHGLGTYLLRFLELQAGERSYRHITIGVDANNPRARKLYEREGFEPLKSNVESWGAVDYLIKALALPEGRS